MNPADLLLFIPVIVWLVLGGYAFRLFVSPADDDGMLYALFIACVVLAPFAFGAALANKAKKK